MIFHSVPDVESVLMFRIERESQQSDPQYDVKKFLIFSFN